LGEPAGTEMKQAIAGVAQRIRVMDIMNQGRLSNP
jgi:hypothetical protein